MELEFKEKALKDIQLKECPPLTTLGNGKSRAVKGKLVENVSERSYLVENVSERSYLVENVSERSCLVENISERSCLVENISERSYLVENVSERSGRCFEKYHTLNNHP